VLSGEATNINFIILGLIRPGLNLTITTPTRMIQDEDKQSAFQIQS
jgi:hypothetical protein